ncbi:MAG: 4,5-dihydroxyphthalate decarboxylase [Rhodospirillales bacterium]|nr:4,5-dihydroxyphthalate decarboxylase [Rhodospirillales bacterium]
MTDHTLTLACWNYDRTLAVLDGRAKVPGWRVDATVAAPEKLFPLAVGEAPFDITEMSLSSYLMQTGRGEGAYVAIPAFVSRAFRHGGIYVRQEAGINTPKDLEGRLVGVPEYQMTMALWARGILQDEYGVDFSTLRYRTGGTNKPGRKERLPLDLPDIMDVEPIDQRRTLNELLVTGELDAVMAPSPPDAFITNGKGPLRQLFTDPVAAEKDYYLRTGLFPIMHVIGVRRTLLEAHPGLAAAVFEAFVKARILAISELEKTARASANRLTLPWFAAEWEATKALMGPSPWPYGVAENRKDLETAVRYAGEQYLSARDLLVEELFAPETLNMAGV